MVKRDSGNIAGSRFLFDFELIKTLLTHSNSELNLINIINLLKNLGGLFISTANRIKQKLEVLRELDKTYEVFGSHKHKYQLNTCINEAELLRFELKHNVTLPEDYRYFLLEIGNGGAGPGYGLYSLKETYANEVDQPFPFEKTTKTIDDEDFESIGNLEVLYFGCQYTANLITAGKEKGNMWLYDDLTFEVVAYSADKSDRYNFLAWYEQWLDVHINCLRNGQKRDRIWSFGYFGKY